MPDVSVITCTARECPLTVSASALGAQTYKDFEWIIVDDLFPTRAEAIGRMAKEHHLAIRYMPPYKLVPYFGYASAANTAIAMAAGRICYFMMDYSIPVSYALERHLSVHNGLGPRTLVSGRTFEPKPEWTGTEDWKPDWEGDHIWQRDGALRWAFFSSKNEVETGCFRSLHSELWWAGRDDSAPTALLLELGGLEELFDGGHGYQDSEFGVRVNMLGGWHVFDTVSMTMELPLHGTARKKILRTDTEQQELFLLLRELRRRTGHYRSIGSELNLPALNGHALVLNEGMLFNERAYEVAV